jgi:hypothetical protein
LKGATNVANEEKKVKCWFCGKEISAEDSAKISFVHDCGCKSRGRLEAEDAEQEERAKIRKEKSGKKDDKSIFGW